MPVAKRSGADRQDDLQLRIRHMCVRQYHDGRQRSDLGCQISGVQGRHHHGQSALQLTTKFFPVCGGILFLVMS